MYSALQGLEKQKAPKRRGEPKEGWQWNPLKEGAWHPDFDVDAVRVEAAKQAVQEAEAKRAAERGSGSADEEDPIKRGAPHCTAHSEGLTTSIMLSAG